MTRVTRTVAVMLATGFLFAGARASSPEEMVKAAKALDESFMKAFNEHNAAAIGGLYWNNPEVVLMPPDAMLVKGVDAIKASFTEMVIAMKDCRLEMIESHNMPAGDVVVGWGLWKLTMPGPDGKPMEMLGRYSDVKAQRDGKWVYLIDHASMPVPPPPLRQPS